MVTPTNRDLRRVSFRYLGRIRNELAKMINAKTHEARGRALDQVMKFFEHLYREAKAQE
jgi:hypothetical protein